LRFAQSMGRAAIIKARRQLRKSWQNVAKSAAKALNSGTMFPTRTIERRGDSIQTCSQFGCNSQKAAPSEWRFAPAALRPAKSPKPLSFQNIQTTNRRWGEPAPVFLFVLNQRDGLNFDARITWQTSRLHRGTSRWSIAEKPAVDFVHRPKILHIE